MTEVLESGTYIILSAADINLTVGVPQVDSIPPGDEVEVAAHTDGFNKIWHVSIVAGGGPWEYGLDIMVSPVDQRFYAQTMFAMVWVNSKGPSEFWTIKPHGFDTYTIQAPQTGIPPVLWTLREDKASSPIDLRPLDKEVPSAAQLWRFIKVPMLRE